MTGPEHYAEAERLLALADRHGRGATYGQEWTLTLAAGDGVDQRVRHLAGPGAGPPVQVQREVDRGGRPRHAFPPVIVVR